MTRFFCFSAKNSAQFINSLHNIIAGLFFRPNRAILNSHAAMINTAIINNFVPVDLRLQVSERPGRFR